MAAVIILLSVWFVPLVDVLAIEREDSGKIIAYGRLEDGETFEIRFIHSIHKTPVIESYHLQDGQIVQDRIEYSEFAIGMPSNAEHGETFSVEDGYYSVSGMNRALDQLDIRIAQLFPEHGLTIRNQYIAFSSVAKPSSWIRLNARKISLWQMMKGANLLGRN
ncbi:DUF1850 domain-containing protein [Paenibacillus faecalis]|uniref:DUF1850 domain-containing protein n=1 Tax=Paenibacillus faecalis TaxID=2079532 RepID=UPI00131A5201|nr:DUF1850 domain-containing protein [Paenibacillus faecalis]